MSQDLSDVLKLIVDRLDAIERRLGMRARLGPQAETEQDVAAREAYLDAEIQKAKKKFLGEPEDLAGPVESVPPVDRSARILASGNPVPEDYSHTALNPITGQQKEYIVLSPEERGKGFVRPVRRSYRHLKCGEVTTMAQSIAETFARDPGFYQGGFCVTCGSHFPNTQFRWKDDGSMVGS